MEIWLTFLFVMAILIFLVFFIIPACVCSYCLVLKVIDKEHTKLQWIIILLSIIFICYQGFLNFYVELATCSVESNYLAEISALRARFQFTNMEKWSLFLPFLFFIICSKSIKDYFSVAFSYVCLLIVSATICFQIIPDKIFRLFLYQYQAESPIPDYTYSFINTSYGTCSQLAWLFFMMAMSGICAILWLLQSKYVFKKEEKQHYW